MTFDDIIQILAETVEISIGVWHCRYAAWHLTLDVNTHKTICMWALYWQSFVSLA